MSHLKRNFIMLLAALLFGLFAMPVAAQEVVPVPTIEPTSAPFVVVPVEVQQSAQDNTAAAVMLFAAIALIVIGAVSSVAIRYVARLVPAEFAAPVYTTGNTFYSKRQRFIEQKRSEAKLNSIEWDDLFWDAAMTISAKDWQSFVDEAAKHGVVLQPMKKE